MVLNPTRFPQAVPFVRDLAGHGGRPALITPDETISYRELASRVDQFGQRLAGPRRLALLSGANTVEALVGYLAALAGGHPVLLAPGDNPSAVAALTEAYDPDLLIAGDRVTERRQGTAHELHPDLALLLSTSGSTGASKLVRLSAANLHSNAEAIADYLAIGGNDRAATTLPMHYCYGLSVVHSHLLIGGSLLLTRRSVTDPEFWQEFTRHRVTSFAGVPYTFDLLERIGFKAMDLPDLRCVTQAGGRLAPELVRRYAELGRRRGWRLFVMYGQTEATARMAYLPPELAQHRPGSIGVPIPGGEFRLDPVPELSDPDTGELVYSGPNVMLGYAHTPADLATGRTVDELRTGDLARQGADGLYEIVGRRARFGKLFGLRVDLDRVEAELARHGYQAGCVSDDQRLVVAVAAGHGPPARRRLAIPRWLARRRGAADPAGEDRIEATVRRLVARECGLPAAAVWVTVLPELPRLASGKLDYPALAAAAAVTAPARDQPRLPDSAGVNGRPGQVGELAAPAAVAGQGEAPVDLRALYAEVLGAEKVTEDDSFASLGGDSLSFVAMSVRLERLLGRLPEDWHEQPIRRLRRLAGGPARRTADLDTSVALRAVAIVLIVGTHATLFGVAGGAHLLLGVAGFNFARFGLTGAGRWRRLRNQARSLGRLVAVSVSWIALVYLFTDQYSLPNLFLLNYVAGPAGAEHAWHFWFIEALVYIQLAALGLLAVPLVDRLERRWPYGLPLVLAGLALVARYELVPGVSLPTPLLVCWLFALGWAAARAGTGWRRLLVTVAVLATVPGFFADPRREAVVVAGMLLLIWLRRLPGTVWLNRLAGALAGASLFIYLTHWQVYPHLFGTSPALATAASLLVGVGYGWLVSWLTGRLAARLRRGWMGRWQLSR